VPTRNISRGLCSRPHPPSGYADCARFATRGLAFSGHSRTLTHLACHAPWRRRPCSQRPGHPSEGKRWDGTSHRSGRGSLWYARGVDQHLCRWATGRGQGMKDINPNAFCGSVDRWRINPTTTRLQRVHDAADHATVINPRLAARVGPKQWLQPCKPILSEPETIAIHRRSPFGDRESQTHRQRNPLYGSGP